MDSILGHVINAKLAMLVTLFGISTEVRLEQPSKAKKAILFTLLDIFTELRFLHFLNAS